MDNSPPVDRISHLPDDILCIILSFLSTKFAFTTTVLSKRWKPLCKLLTSLSFNDKLVDDEFLPFWDLVDTVTLSTQLIKTLYLSCHSPNWHRFDSWIGNAKRHPVENLQITNTACVIHLCPSIFRFPLLVVLKL